MFNKTKIFRYAQDDNLLELDNPGIMMSSILQQLKQLGVRELSFHSDQLDAHTAFIALKGMQRHGLDFIDQVIQAKAACILIDAKDSFSSDHIQIIKVPNLQNHSGDFASEFYDHPSRKLKIHAVTGTNGKTSCSQFIAQALAILGERCGVIGTLGMGVWPDLKEISNTTPDAVTLQRFLAHCVAQGVKHVAMEASSIALDQGRMQGCEIHSAIFTNLTQDHLDYHGSMEAYAAAKRQLFDFPGLQHIIVNADDPFGGSFPRTRESIFYSSITMDSRVRGNDVRVLSTSFTGFGITAQVQTPQDTGELKSPLLGQFNLENLLAVLSWMLVQDIPLEKALAIIPQLKNPRGRMECLRLDGKALMVIDYAHTPDALEKALKALRIHCEGRLWCVFGCGGNRDKTKRPLMGKIALEFADQVIVTSDNPRDEDPEEIINAVIARSTKRDAATQILSITDRAAAIEYAIKNAKSCDVILIAGKGHETYQEIKGQKYPFDDREIAHRFLV